MTPAGRRVGPSVRHVEMAVVGTAGPSSVAVLRRLRIAQNRGFCVLRRGRRRARLCHCHQEGGCGLAKRFSTDKALEGKTN
ncbi:unnamed protein product [Soboliphyme baturini]|uniref:Uncharacterized protein n=1 Tax=Soboliphyme baturini TaxID=241478 RepID=A0A183IFZ8_9BILA|nr:unnamed protein product [Soboliphyme baturini]